MPMSMSVQSSSVGSFAVGNREVLAVNSLWNLGSLVGGFGVGVTILVFVPLPGVTLVKLLWSSLIQCLILNN